MARSGAIIVVQRFGGALNLNVHLHALILDGVFARAGDGQLRFHRAPGPTASDVADVLATVVPGVRVRLGRSGLDDDGGEDADRAADAAPVLAGLVAASVQGVLALGGAAGRRPQRMGEAGGATATREPAAVSPETPHARWEGFDLHAGVAIPGHRARLERLCRYVLRPPVTSDRLTLTADGRVVLRLRHPWADGTTHLGFEPTAFLERLAVLVPRPRTNLLLYHGVLAPHGAWRAEVVPRTRAEVRTSDAAAPPEADATVPASPAGRRWADLMRRAFEVDVLACGCGGRLRLLALLEAGTVTTRILRSLGLPPEVPAARPARAPPLPHDDDSGITPAMASPQVGAGSVYAFTPHDADGNYPDGSKTYEVTLPGPVPMNNFWSFVVYSTQHRSMLETDQRFAGLDSTPETLRSNDDGSHTVWFGPEAPDGQEGNWVQTMPGKGFAVTMRLYGPLEPWFDKTWKPSDLELVEQSAPGTERANPRGPPG